MSGTPICVDASLVVRLLQGSAGGASVAGVWRSWLAEGRPLVAPALLFYEVTNALRRYVVAGEMTGDGAAQALGLAMALPVQLHEDADLHQRALEMAARFGLPAAYDAHYLALAEQLGAEFWTADRRLGHAIGSAVSWVRLVESLGQSL